MAWQLIYTSAPRLLEAGRTGFGTVARHRAVSGMLASAVERFSQFARLPGHDPRRIVHTYRILTVGSGTFHVLSCLQDAGSDYTGRTNHIAHHLIAEPREIRTLAAAGLTPADVLMGMAWRTSWSEGPRYLDSAEEIDLTSYASRPSHAWSAITGNPASAGILWSRDAIKGCYLITPPGANVLELFRESLLAVPAQAWQTRFTTCLEPNDDLADFRWVALTSASPLRSQVETSNRLVLDLTRPNSLPEPPEVETPAPASQAPAPAAPLPPPPQVQAMAAPSMSLPSAGAEPIGTMGGWSPETRQRTPKGSRSYIGVSLAIAALLIAGVSGGLLWHFNQQQQANQVRNAYETAIAKLWKDNGILLLDETRKFLQDQPALNDGNTLLKSHEEFFRSMKQVLNQPDKQTPLTQLTENKDDLTSFKKLLEEWAVLHKTPWASLQNEKDTATAASIDESFRKWERSRKATWEKLKRFLSLNAPPLLSDELLQPLKDVAKEALKNKEPERGSRESWKELFTLPDQKGQMDTQVQRWLTLWGDIDANSITIAQEASDDNSLPVWLREKALRVKQQNNPDKMVDPGKNPSPYPTKEPPKPKIAMEDADAIPAKHDIHICRFKSPEDKSPGDPISMVTGLKVDADMQLYVGAAADVHPNPDGKTAPKDGEVKKWVTVKLDGKSDIIFGPTITSQQNFQFSIEGKLIAVPESLRNSPAGIRLVARSKDGTNVLFDLRILPSKSSPALLLPFVLKTALIISPEFVDSPELGQLLNHLRFIDSTTQYKLRPPLNINELWDLSLQGEKCAVSAQQSATATNGLAIANQKNLIQTIKDGIKSQENLKENLKSSQTDYAAKLQQYDTAIAVKKAELTEAENKLAELEKPKELPKPKTPVAAEYILIALPVPGIVIDICKVQILPPSKNSVKPAKP